MRYEETVFIKEKFLEMIRKYLTEEPAGPAEGLGEDEVISVNVPFLDGYEMDIRCCGVRFEEGECNKAWSEAILFCEGSQVALSDPCDEFEGDWKLDDWNGNTYIVHIKSETEMEVLARDS